MKNTNQLRTKEDIINYLQLAKAEGEANFLEALAIVAKERGISQLSNEAGLNRENLYRSLKAGAKPRYTTIEKVLLALGIDSKLISIEKSIEQDLIKQ